MEIHRPVNRLPGSRGRKRNSWPWSFSSAASCPTWMTFWRAAAADTLVMAPSDGRTPGALWRKSLRVFPVYRPISGPTTVESAPGIGRLSGRPHRRPAPAARHRPRSCGGLIESLLRFDAHRERRVNSFCRFQQLTGQSWPRVF